MAFLKFARAAVVTPFVTRDQWRDIRVAGRSFAKTRPDGTGFAKSAALDLAANLADRAAALFDQPFNPKDFLLTHATIVASVDTYAPKDVKLGKVREDGFRVNRKYADYRIKGDCQKFINNNRDAWSRGVIAKSYQTFIGGHNFVEHVQIEDLSKGRIIDAVGRDIGDSVYVDILIATERKHRDLVTAIQNGKMGTLSMGCTVDGTICTKCGHWASDETEMCSHVKYEKGNVFYDKEGRKHIVAELCGHETLDPTGGVQFIEASWVEIPAFTGAVLRNVLEPTIEMARKARKVLASPPTQWAKDARRKAASAYSMSGLPPMESEPSPVLVGRVSDRALRLAQGEDEMMPDEGGAATPEAPKSPELLQGLEDELTQALLEKVRKRVEDAIKGPGTRPSPEQSSSTNENAQQLASRKAGMFLYRKMLSSIVRTASSDAQMIDRIADFHQGIGLQIPVSVYRTALRVGALHGYRSQQEFLTSCRKILGRSPTKAEAGALLRLGKLLSQIG